MAAVPKTCPCCGKEHTLRIHPVGRKLHCTSCYSYNIEPILERQQQTTKNRVVMNYIPDEATENDLVTERNDVVGLDGVVRSEPVAVWHLRRGERTPDLVIDAMTAQKVRWCLKEHAANERRYGRDDLRKRGFVRRVLKLKTRDLPVWIEPAHAEKSDAEIVELLQEMVRGWQRD